MTQAAYGTPAFFSLLQSAAMGGYGAAAISASAFKTGLVAGGAVLAKLWTAGSNFTGLH
jgi:hypothetical protein